MTLRSKQLIASFLDLLHEKIESKIVSVFLYGSYARGDYNKHSDIDILIVVKNLDKLAENKILDACEDALSLIDYNELLVPYIISTKHYEKMKKLKTDFFRNLKRESKSLWKKKTKPTKNTKSLH